LESECDSEFRVLGAKISAPVDSNEGTVRSRRVVRRRGDGALGVEECVTFPCGRH
jgi:hypothetical protein